MKERKVYLDYLRVIATVFVICVHTVSLAAAMVEPQSTAYRVLEVFDFVFLSCNLLFLMISGALLLPVEGERIGTFFHKRFLRVLIPLVVYYVCYVSAKEGIEWLYPDHWLLMLRRILTGAPEEAPHFWLVYVIFWLYVLTPFLRWIVHHIPDSVLTGVIVVIFFVNGLDTYLPVWGFDAHLSPVVDSFAGVFLLGYFLGGRSSVRAERILFAGGVASFFLTVFLIWRTNLYEPYIYNNAPTMMLFASAVFIAVKRAASHCNRENRILRFVGSYSFSILLIHWGVLHVGVKQLLHVNVQSGGIWGGCLLMIALTFLLSTLGAVIVDNTLMRFIYMLIDKISSCFRSKKY